MDNAPVTQQIPEGTKMTLFWTLTLKTQIHCTNKRSIKHLIQDIHNILNQIGSYTLNPECHLSGNIHFHGMLYVKDKVKYYILTKKLNEIGGFNAQYPRTVGNTVTYTQKDNPEMEEILGVRLPLTNSSTTKLLIDWVIAKAAQKKREWGTFDAKVIDVVYKWDTWIEELLRLNSEIKEDLQDWGNSPL